MNFREALDGLICIAMFNAIAERVAVNEVDNNLYSPVFIKIFHDQAESDEWFYTFFRDDNAWMLF